MILFRDKFTLIGQQTNWSHLVILIAGCGCVWHPQFYRAIDTRYGPYHIGRLHFPRTSYLVPILGWDALGAQVSVFFIAFFLSHVLGDQKRGHGIDTEIMLGDQRQYHGRDREMLPGDLRWWLGRDREMVLGDQRRVHRRDIASKDAGWLVARSWKRQRNGAMWSEVRSWKKKRNCAIWSKAMSFKRQSNDAGWSKTISWENIIILIYNTKNPNPQRDT